MNYVSFEEAMKANIEGKTVKSWLDREDQPYNIHYQHYEEAGTYRMDIFKLLGEEVTRFSELKWTIEE
jgi:hypothetical protein